MNSEILIRTYAGLEEVLAQEVGKLGGINPQAIVRGVTCQGDEGFIYKLNLALRTGLRVLKPLHEFEFRNNEDFHREVMSIDWPSYFDVKKTISVDTLLFSDRFKNSMFVSQLAKDGICDRFRNDTGKRPFVDGHKPDIQISVYVRNYKAVVYLDSSGESLHIRGYRANNVIAPLSEVLAAGILSMTGWSHHFPLYDPMCGSATFSIEAALMADKIPPGIFREGFSFMNWKSFDPELFSTIREGLVNRIEDNKAQIFASDINRRAVEAAKDNIYRAGVEDVVKLQTADFRKLDPPGKKALVILNPPYGERLKPEDIEKLYSEIGSVLKHTFAGSEAWIFSAAEDAFKYIGLKPSRKIKLFNGSLECKLLRFEMYAGSKKLKMNEKK
ncbi:MAG: THUMP domain-containing protein [Bacteroidia bacterium]